MIVGPTFFSSPPSGGPLTFVASIITNDDTGVDIPAHEAGDLIIAIGRNKFTFPSAAPPAPTGFTEIMQATPNFGNASSVHWAIDTGNTLTTIANAVNYTWLVLVYRNASGIGDAQVRDLDDVGTTATMPTLTLVDPGNSVAIAVLSTNQGYVSSDPSGMTRREDNDSPSYGGGNLTAWDEFFPATFSGKTASWSPAAYWVTYSLEILPL